jgi:RimJ/RimL family protein N-acetyltransferase
MIEFRRVRDFPRGTLYRQLTDAYAFDDRYRRTWDDMWMAHDDFFCSNPSIADQYAFITAVDGNAVGHISWDPRNRPDHVCIGHNCILTAFKGRGYGKLQLREAVRRIWEYPGLRRILVTTNALTVPAQRNYESAGFVKVAERPNADTPFAGNYIDYEMVISRIRAD